MNKFLIVFVITVFSLINAKAQSRDQISGSVFWEFGQNNLKKLKNSNPFSDRNNLVKTFNFNPTIDFKEVGFSKDVKNIVKNQSTLFLVYKTTNEATSNLFKLEKGDFKLTFDTEKIVSGNEYLLNKGNKKTGVIVSYVSSNNKIFGKKNGKIVFDDKLFTEKDSKNELMEMIYIPKTISEKERIQIENYLSIKHGISLVGSQNYFDSTSDTIWNYKKNIKFKTRVTGIGADAKFGLNQKQSGNSEKDGLYIGLTNIAQSNEANQSEIVDRKFLIWGDNNKSVLIDGNKSQDRIDKMKRVWKIQTSDDCLKSFENTTVLLNKTEMKLENEVDLKEKDQRFWMVIDSSGTDILNYSVSKFVKATVDDEKQLVFNNVNWQSNSSYLFSFVKAPDFFVALDANVPDCNFGLTGNLKIKIVGGIAPYKISVIGLNYEKSFTTNETDLKISDLAQGKYRIKVSDVKESFNKDFTIDSFGNDNISLEPEYYLKDNKVMVSPIMDNNQENLNFEWLLDTQIVSNNSSANLIRTGNYKLIATNVMGCKKEIPFVVKQNQGNFDGQWMLFPNPVASGEEFTIGFRLKDLSKVVVTITDLDGRIIETKNLDRIKVYEYKSIILIQGTYLVNTSINGLVTTNKLIVK